MDQKKVNDKIMMVNADVLVLGASGGGACADLYDITVQEIIEAQQEVIYTLGEIIETRSKEAAKHVVGVAEYSYLIGCKYGLTKDDAILLKIAAPMHDNGNMMY